MKTHLIFFLCMIASIITFGQEKKEPDYVRKGVSVSPPLFFGLVESWQDLVEGKANSIDNYMARMVQYPPDAIKNLIQGTSIVNFIVSEKGEISDIKVINRVSEEVDNEVIRVLKNTGGMWRPGMANGEPVAMENEVSVTFKLTDQGKYKDFEYLGKKYFTKGSIMLFTHDNPKQALKYFNLGMTIFPKDKNMLLMRGIARYETGDTKGACQDWNRIKMLGGIESDEYLNNLCGYKGYAAMVQIVKE